MFDRILLLILFTLPSCALFHPTPSLKNEEIDKVLAAIKVTGEGRGRLGIGKQNYVFSYDALIKEQDWILAVSVPLHGEEVMILHEIDKKVPPPTKLESFELRIDRDLRARLKLGRLTGKEVTQEMRSLIRFIHAPNLSLTRNCKSKEETFTCSMDGEEFFVEVLKDYVKIRKNISSLHYFELTAEHLNKTSFGRTNFHLKSYQNKTSAMSLELFWK